MTYTGYQLLWFFLIYSFMGWCGEVAVSVIKQHKFVNRGFVTGPLCPIYGMGAFAFAIFLPDLKNDWIFLFLGSMILASFIEYITGKCLTAITGKMWWDYSRYHYNLNGIISLPTSLLWGACGVFAIKMGNGLLIHLIHLLPKPIGWICVWTLLGILTADYLGSFTAILGLRRNAQIDNIKEGLSKTSRLLENALTRQIQRRMLKAFPEVREKDASVFGSKCGIYKLFLIFLISSFLGDIVETIFMLATTGKLVCRSSVVYGQFSIVWGLACVLATIFLYQFREKSDRYVFLWGTVLGGAYEYVCSVFTEVVFGAVFWNYSKLPFNLGGRINLLFCFFWGIASVAWIKGVYPRLSDLIDRIPKKAGHICAWLLAVFMIMNMVISSAAVIRYTERNCEPTATVTDNKMAQLVDERFPDERMVKRYPYMRFRR